MHKKIGFLAPIVFSFLAAAHLSNAQVPFDQIEEDKKEMTDSYYGTFKYEGNAFTGKAIAYHENGKIKTLRTFKNGSYHGMWTEWYDNGNRKFQGDRRKNMGQGLTKWWYPNGQLKKQGTYVKDIQDGVVLRWHDNGQISLVRYFDNGNPTGGWTTFDNAGDVIDEGNSENLFYKAFLGPNEPGWERASPSFTADGKTMAFVQYNDWMKKVPHLATLSKGEWNVERLEFTDYVYNMAISPNGDRIIYKVYEEIQDDKDLTRTFLVQREAKGWSAPMEITNLFDLNAGYYQIATDGSLYMFARTPRKGTFVSFPQEEGFFSKPEWISDNLSPYDITSFDAIVNDAGDKLIVTQADFPKEHREELGENGFYYYEKRNGDWTRIKRLPLAYGWGANVTPDGKFVYVRNDNIVFVALEDLNIEW
ncbi:MAG: hypothetical protein HKN16_12120 [Saprospiraceae bacterium]|nr:hypothetical protein [Saprospiraceae bacterium]